MTTFVGGCIALGGGLQMFSSIENASKIGDHKYVNAATTCGRITRLAANVLDIIGTFLLGLGSVVIGHTMMTLALQMPFFLALQEGVKVSIPYLAGGLGSLFMGGVVYQIVRPEPAL